MSIRDLRNEERSVYYKVVSVFSDWTAVAILNAREDVDKSIWNGVWKYLYNKERGNFYWAIHNGKRKEAVWDKLYPDAYAQLFPILFGLLEENVTLKNSLWQDFNKFYSAKIDNLSTEQSIIFELTKKHFKK